MDKLGQQVPHQLRGTVPNKALRGRGGERNAALQCGVREGGSGVQFSSRLRAHATFARVWVGATEWAEWSITRPLTEGSSRRRRASSFATALRSKSSALAGREAGRNTCLECTRSLRVRDYAIDCCLRLLLTPSGCLCSTLASDRGTPYDCRSGAIQRSATGCPHFPVFLRSVIGTGTGGRKGERCRTNMN